MSNIGTILHFNKKGCDDTIREVLPLVEAANEVINQYNELEVLHPFTTETLHDIKRNGIRSIRTQYEKFVVSEISRLNIRVKSQLATLKESSHTDLKLLENAIENLLNTENKLARGAAREYAITLDDIDVVDGEAIVTDSLKNRIKERYTVRIENELEASLHENMTMLKEAWDQVMSDIKAMGIPLKQPLNPYGSLTSLIGIVRESPDTTLFIEPDYMDRIKRTIKHQSIAKNSTP